MTYGGSVKNQALCGRGCCSRRMRSTPRRLSLSMSRDVGNKWNEVADEWADVR